MKTIHLKKGKEIPVKRFHPWIFSGGIARVAGNPRLGDTVEVCGDDGAFLAVAAYSPESQIRARVWDWKAVNIDADFFAQRIARAAAARGGFDVSGVRLVHGESDGLPGVVADRYEETVVVQLLSAGAELWRGKHGNVDDIVGRDIGVERDRRSDPPLRADAEGTVGIRRLSGLLGGGHRRTHRGGTLAVSALGGGISQTAAPDKVLATGASTLSARR